MPVIHIASATELANYKIKEENEIQELQAQAYNYWLNKIEVIYEQLISDHGYIDRRPYQAKYAALYCTRPKNLCAGEMGIGKSFIALLMIYAIYGDNLAHRRPGTIQILAPKRLSAESRWLVDARCIAGLRDQVSLITKAGDTQTNESPVWIYTHDFLKRKHPALRGNTKDSVSDYISRYRRPSCLVLDEIHNCKPGSKRSQHVAKVRRRANRFLALSGTLTDGRLDLLNYCLSLTYGEDWQFYNRNKEFTDLYGTQKKISSNYVRGEEELFDQEKPNRTLGTLALHKAPEFYSQTQCYIHRSKLSDPDVLPTLHIPDSHIETETIKMTTAQQSLYEAIIFDNWSAFNRLAEITEGRLEHRAAALNLIRKLIYVTSCPSALSSNLNLVPAKATLVINKLRDAMKAREKTVVFCNAVAGARLISALCASEASLCDAYKRVYASDDLATPAKMSEDARADALSQFLFNPDVMIGIMSINITHESIDLTSAQNVIFYDLPWQAIKILQALCRAVRPGNPHPLVKTLFPITEGTVDVYIYQLMSTKMAASRRIHDFDFSDSSDASSLNPLNIIRSIVNERS